MGPEFEETTPSPEMTLFKTHSAITAASVQCCDGSGVEDPKADGGFLKRRQDDPELRKAVFSLEGCDGAKAFLNTGMRRQKSGDLEGALAAFREALQIRIFMLQAGTGGTELQGSELHSALFLCKEALEISECTGTQLTPEGALLTGIYGILLHLRGDADHAHNYYPLALQVLEELHEEHGHTRAVLLGSLGDARSELGYHKSAIVSFMEAHQVRLVKRTLQSYEGAQLMISIGLTKFAMDDPFSALEAYTLAVLVFDALGQVNTNNFAVLLNFIGMAKTRCGEYADATETLKQALSIRKKLDSLDTVDGRYLQANLQRTKRELQRKGPVSPRSGNTPRSHALRGETLEV